MIGILDLQSCNLRSISNAVYEIGGDYLIVKQPNQISGISHLIIPGVGHFQSVMQACLRLNFVEPIREFVASGFPVLGICLGMQLLASVSEEGGAITGLDLIKGSVKKFSFNSHLPIPHVGWNAVNFLQQHPIFDKIPNQHDFYFVHSYHFVPDNIEHDYAKTEYGYDFCSVVANQNIVGCQFHPEKSQKNGLQFIENFIGWDGKC